MKDKIKKISQKWKKTIVKKDHYESQVENKLVSKHNKYRALVYFITNNLFLPNVYYDFTLLLPMLRGCFQLLGCHFNQLKGHAFPPYHCFQ